MFSQSAPKHLFYTEMAKLLAAGFDIRKAADVMRDTRLPPSQQKLLDDLEHGLAAGRSITESYGEDRKKVSDLERVIIGAGERGGRLAPAFQHLADYYGMLARAHSHVVKSLIYPVVILHLGVFISVVPGAVMKGETSGIVGKLLLALLVVYVIAAVVVSGAVLLLRAGPKSKPVDRLLNLIPIVGKARRSFAMARFVKVYHTCLLAGLTMSETVQSATAAAHSGVIRQAGQRLFSTATAGDLLGPVFIKSGAFPKAFARSYATAEASGSLDTDLARWAGIFQEDAESSARSLSIALPKVLYALVVAFVVWKILGFYSDYYGALENLSE